MAVRGERRRGESRCRRCVQALKIPKKVVTIDFFSCVDGIESSSGRLVQLQHSYVEPGANQGSGGGREPELSGLDRYLLPLD